MPLAAGLVVGILVGGYLGLRQELDRRVAIQGVQARIDRMDEELFQCEGALEACLVGELLLFDKLEQCGP